MLFTGVGGGSISVVIGVVISEGGFSTGARAALVRSVSDAERFLFVDILDDEARQGSAASAKRETKCAKERLVRFFIGPLPFLASPGTDLNDNFLDRFVFLGHALSVGAGGIVDGCARLSSGGLEKPL